MAFESVVYIILTVAYLGFLRHQCGRGLRGVNLSHWAFGDIAGEFG